MPATRTLASPVDPAHAPRVHVDRELTRHVIQFDPKDRATFQSTTKTTHTKLAPIPWPKSLEPVPRPFPKEPSESAPVPRADVLVVTWTVAEARALADVLTPGYESTAWYYYKNDWDWFARRLEHGAPALESKRLASYLPITIGKKKVLCMKSELHMARDGKDLPVRDIWTRLIDQTRAKLVISTGTAGAIGRSVALGGVVVAPSATFHCHDVFKHAPFNGKTFHCPIAVPDDQFKEAVQTLIPVNARNLPKGNARPKILWRDGAGFDQKINIVTTDFFAFDTSDNYYGLQGLGSAVEMGDAVLGLAASEMGKSAPAWCCVRNASDPQIPSKGSLEDQSTLAGKIYEEYGYWTTVDSAITTWAVIAAS
jgi:hypothetical protein